MKTKKFYKGNIIIKQDQDVNHAYVILSGHVEVFKKLNPNETITITKLGPSQIFGEMSLFGDKKATASVRAVSDVELQIVDKKLFEEQLNLTPPLIKVLLEIMANRLQKTSDKYTIALISEAQPIIPLKRPNAKDVDFDSGKIKE